MTILGIRTLVLPIPLASLNLSTILIHRFALLTILYCALLSYNMIYVVLLFTSIEKLRGLFQLTILFKIPLISGDFSLIEESNMLLSLIPIIVYTNAETDKSTILTATAGKAGMVWYGMVWYGMVWYGIYLWTHKESGKEYVGSSVDLSKRLKDYYSPSKLKKWDNYISRALIFHTYSAFSLSILEFIDITDLSKQDLKKLILSREQHYIDSLEPEYNTLKIAGSLLGFKYSEENLKNRRGEKYPFFGKNHTPETIAHLSSINIGVNHPMYGRSPSTETIAKLSESKKGENNPMFGKVAVNAKNIYIYSLENKLIKECSSIKKAAEWLNIYRAKVRKYLSTKEVFNNKYIIRNSIIDVRN